ncbi:MAG: PKD domain-containing protein [Euryarchaeota archaeon]|nr:PKD domain-containing protein [Euryarchaeota archaeon]
MHKIAKMVIVIGITIAFLTPVSLVIGDDVEPPVITSVSYGPHAGIRTDPGFFLYQSCTVTDNISVTDVRINITGPIGFVSLNESMIQVSPSNYSYEVYNITLSGTYWFYIWAIDSSNNSAHSQNYHMIVLDTYLNYVYVDNDNTVGPWQGTAQYPLQYINDAVAVVAVNGTIFINDGVYENTSIGLNKNMNLVGENRLTTILDGGGSNTTSIISVTGNQFISITNMTLQNAIYGVHTQNSSNTTITQCSLSQCSGAALFLADTEYLLVNNCDITNNNQGIQLNNSSFNLFYHNNFVNNIIHVSTSTNASSNGWDNGLTGNYWDTYRAVYPDATVIPATGTWDTPYVVTVSGSNIDFHPWVYPSGHIDTIPPQVTLLYPNGGEELYGTIAIQWSASDDSAMDLNGSILLEYSPDNGNIWMPIASNQNNTGVYLWNTSEIPNGDQYLISVTVFDEFFNVGSDTSDNVFTLNNFQPGDLQITGPSLGGNGIPFHFSVVASDPRGEQIYYKWDWGDGNETAWLGPFNSNISTTETYAWAKDGNYSIRVKAMNTGGTESNWSKPHIMYVAELINFSNVQLGHIYFKLFSFNRSFLFSDFLARLGVVIILTSHEMDLKANASDIVQSVTFKAENQLKIETMEITDTDGSDGFSCIMNVTRGTYILNISAYDGNGSLVDRYSLFTVFFVRVGRYATGPPSEARLLNLRNISRLRH